MNASGPEAIGRRQRQNSEFCAVRQYQTTTKTRTPTTRNVFEESAAGRGAERVSPGNGGVFRNAIFFLHRDLSIAFLSPPGPRLFARTEPGVANIPCLAPACLLQPPQGTFLSFFVSSFFFLSFFSWAVLPFLVVSYILLPRAPSFFYYYVHVSIYFVLSPAFTACSSERPESSAGKHDL